MKTSGTEHVIFDKGPLLRYQVRTTGGKAVTYKKKKFGHLLKLHEKTCAGAKLDLQPSHCSTCHGCTSSVFVNVVKVHRPVLF